MIIKDFLVSQKEFTLQYHPKYELWETRPTPKNFEKYYQSEKYISHTDQNQGFFAKIYQWVKKINIKNKINWVCEYTPNKGNILDIGAGTGDFVALAKKYFKESYGIEPSSIARKNALKKNILLFENETQLPQKRFDCITMWHVLEHIPQLEKQILFLKEHLQQGGTLIIAVPNYKSYDAKHYQAFWAAYDVPRHLWHFSRQSIEKLFSEQGFRLVGTHPMWFDAFYVCILSEKNKKSKFAFLKGMILGAYSNFRAIFTKEYSSVVYVLKK